MTCREGIANIGSLLTSGGERGDNEASTLGKKRYAGMEASMPQLNMGSMQYTWISTAVFVFCPPYHMAHMLWLQLVDEAFQRWLVEEEGVVDDITAVVVKLDYKA